MRQATLLGQGLYYLATGIWPIVHISSFMRVSGPKRDIWLVKTVGVLVTVIGAALVLASLRRRPGAEVEVLAGGSAAGLSAIGAVYALKRTISPVYLLDVGAEVLVLAGLVFARLRRPSPPNHQVQQYSRLAAADLARQYRPGPTVPAL
jgi:hypothetical protein